MVCESGAHGPATARETSGRTHDTFIIFDSVRVTQKAKTLTARLVGMKFEHAGLAYNRPHRHPAMAVPPATPQ